jgi:hypothetical protein
VRLQAGSVQGDQLCAHLCVSASARSRSAPGSCRHKEQRRLSPKGAGASRVQVLQPLTSVLLACTGSPLKLLVPGGTTPVEGWARHDGSRPLTVLLVHGLLLPCAWDCGRATTGKPQLKLHTSVWGQPRILERTEKPNTRQRKRNRRLVRAETVAESYDYAVKFRLGRVGGAYSGVHRSTRGFGPRIRDNKDEHKQQKSLSAGKMGPDSSPKYQSLRPWQRLQRTQASLANAPSQSLSLPVPSSVMTACAGLSHHSSVKEGLRAHSQHSSCRPCARGACAHRPTLTGFPPRFP